MATPLQPPTPISTIPENLSPDSIDTLPVLAEILSRLQDLSPDIQPSPLSTKDVPKATDALKHKLQKARVQVKELPDVERSIAEQEEEIRMLEERIGKQRALLERLKAVGEEARKEKEERKSVLPTGGEN